MKIKIGKRRLWQFSMLIIIGLILVWAKITGQTAGIFDGLLTMWGVGLFIIIGELIKNRNKT